MSFIVGMNLSDRVYLSADTRLTFESGDKKQYLDNVLKIKPLSQEIAVAVAGHIELAAFVVRRILESNLDRTNIRKFRDDVPALIKKLCDEYLGKNKFQPPVCFMFAGINRNQEKIVSNMDKYMEAVKGFQGEDENALMNMKDVIVQGMNRKGSGKLGSFPIPTPDSHVFCVQALPTSFSVEDVELWDFIAYGGGLTKKKLPPRFIGQFEVATKGDNELRHDRGWLDIFMKTIAEENKVSTIGGCTTSLIISEKVSGMLIGGTARRRIGKIIVPDEVISEVTIENKKLYCTIDRQKQKLIPFVKYPELLLKQNPKIEYMVL